MSQFEDALQREIEQAQRSLTTAEPSEDGGQFEQHRARLRDLLDVAARANVDTSGWISPAARALLAGD
ncbi:hypothetical protein UK23_16385 [Lentzea aerocolonigenes]|uniref:Uncharacterized protein n=1 Tax=Lentzea aerocolonigenes TaxID=68170 RepID=A0A0F0H315_LENAE|nr:hypothetical protein [Lentzea aerocolonigenes]KJK48677.1 hypothetical protein UK23_16385 [Lentzea aerocolonigenes]